jgi:peroxiredoxin
MRWLAGVLAAVTWIPLADAQTPAGNIGKKVTNFTLTDPRNQERIQLNGLKDQKAIVVLFLGTECPINNAYLPRLAKLHQEFAERKVQFVAINSNRQDPAERVAEHARKFAVPFPVLKDPGNVVADAFGAKRTPEAFVLDSTFTIRYHGRIDDQYGLSIQRPKPTRRDLAEAIAEVLAGQAVSQPTTPVAGCVIGRDLPVKKDGSVTFARDVSRILQKKCQECHRPGQVAPMPLLSYDDAAAWAATIREVVADGRMPPWLADPRHGKFLNDRRLSDADRRTLLDWIEQGCPKGDDRDLPPPIDWPEDWKIGKPDLVLTMPEEFAVPAQAPRGGVPYQHFVLDPKFTEDKWVERAEARPGEPSVVHHVLVFVVPPGRSFFKDDPRNIVLCGTAPGDSPTVARPGTAKRIPAGSKLVMQVHYTPNGMPQRDRSSLALIFAKQPPRQEIRTVPIFNAFFAIPPGAEDYKVEASYAFRQDGFIHGMMPHMHLRGKSFRFEAIYPDGKTEILLSIPRFDFSWQSGFRPVEPIFMPKGSKLRCIAHFDNSDKNPNNPDPSRTVYWGDQTWQEMMIGWTDIIYDLPAK